MKKNKGYWVSVGLFCAVYTFSAIMDLFGVGPAQATLAHLGYPAFVASILGTWKAGAVVTLLAPRLARLKEWAYAGIFFDLSGGFVSHVAAGDALPKPVVPLVLLALALTSYFLRPEGRKLESPRATTAVAPRAAVAAGTLGV
jgi:hypothetical protein